MEGQGEATEESGMREWKRESDSEEGGIVYLGGTLDSSHLFQNQAQPLSLFVNVARLAFAPRGLSRNKNKITQAQQPALPFLDFKCVFHHIYVCAEK